MSHKTEVGGSPAARHKSKPFNAGQGDIWQG